MTQPERAARGRVVDCGMVHPNETPNSGARRLLPQDGKRGSDPLRKHSLAVSRRETQTFRWERQAREAIHGQGHTTAPTSQHGSPGKAVARRPILSFETWLQPAALTRRCV